MAAEIHQVELDNVTLSVTSQGEGPTVVLLHGFPDIGYSWRHQIPVLADAGYRVLAPDQRGYGWSDIPDGVESYGITQLVGDVIGLLDAEGADDAVVIGHDWGAIVAPWVALFRPDRVRAIGLLSVPFRRRGDMSVIDHIRSTDPEGPFSYMLGFQEEGIEAFMDADPLDTLRRVHWSTAGSRPADYARGDEPPAGLPDYLEPGAMENYGRAFARTGFGPGINWYRNLHRNWVETRPWHDTPLTVPTMFLAGARDFVVAEGDGTLADVDEMAAHCADHRGTTIVDGGGHWVHQECIDEVNAALLAFLAALD